MKFPWFIWIPRILIMLFIAFVALFSLDVFEGEASIWYKLLGLLIHNVPALLLLLTLLLTWRRPLIGGIVFAVLMVLLTVLWQTYEAWETFLFFTVPMLVVAVLFLLVYFISQHKAEASLPKQQPPVEESLP